MLLAATPVLPSILNEGVLVGGGGAAGGCICCKMLPALGVTGGAAWASKGQKASSMALNNGCIGGKQRAGVFTVVLLFINVN